jgi:hypothetical protein
MHEDLAYLVENVIKVQDETKKMMENKKLSEKTGNALMDKLEELRKTLVATKEGQITGEQRLRERLGWLYITVTWDNGKPTDSQMDGINNMQYEIDEAVKAIFTEIT